MFAIHPYLQFDGNAREAFECYAKWLGADLRVFTYGDSPTPGPPEAKDRVIHARLLRNGAAILMASDFPLGMEFRRGHGCAVSVACENADEVDRLFVNFSDGATISMPPQDTFWNARFAMLTDRFGVEWMFNFEKVPML